MEAESLRTLFVDRDGVINNKLEQDYVKKIDELEILPGVPEAFKIFSVLFERIIVVTNQQGIGKGLMSENDLQIIHKKIKEEISNAGGRIDDFFFCAHLASANCDCRKPKTGMAMQAKEKYPEIDFSNSLMIGDSEIDMRFADSIGAAKIFISAYPKSGNHRLEFKSLIEVAQHLFKESRG